MLTHLVIFEPYDELYLHSQLYDIQSNMNGSLMRDLFQRQVGNSAATPSGASRSFFSRHSWLPTQLSHNGEGINLTGNMSKNVYLRFACFLKAIHPSLTSLCSPPQLSCVLPDGGWRDVGGRCLGGHVIRFLLPA